MIMQNSSILSNVLMAGLLFCRRMQSVVTIIFSLTMSETVYSINLVLTKYYRNICHLLIG